MLLNHLKIAIRQIHRDRATSFINIFGLAIAIGVASLIGMYVWQESDYDQFYQTEDPLYRVYRHWGEGNEWVHAPGELSDAMASEIPEVVAATHIRPVQEVLLGFQGKEIYAERAMVVDSNFFKTLPFPFKQGNPDNVFEAPNTAVLSARMANVLFGDDDPIGKSIEMDGTGTLAITGVLEEGLRSHLDRDIYIKQSYPNWGWLSNGFASYVRLHPEADLALVQEKIATITRPHLELAYKTFGYEIKESNFSDWGLQPVNEVHLHSSNGYYWEDIPGGNIQYLYIFGIIAMVMLSLAIFNYTNLSTARATLRAKEIGVRKVTGARQEQLVTQFLTETLLHTGVAFGIGIAIAYTATPIFENLVQVDLSFDWQKDFFLIPLSLLGIFAVGILSGIYPALILSRFAPDKVLRNDKISTYRRFSIRQVLVTAQFIVVIAMLGTLGMMVRQINYMLDQELGFDSEQVIVLPHNSYNTGQLVKNQSERIKNIPNIEEVSVSSQVPGQALGTWSLIYKEADKVEPVTIATEMLYANESLAETWGLELVNGRFFDARKGVDTINFVVNEAFVKANNLKDPLNTPIKLFADSVYRSIIGVVKDFHFNSLEQQIRPIAITGAGVLNNTSIRLQTKDLNQTIAQVEQIWQAIEPHHPMRYSFLDESFAQQYGMQQRFRKGLSIATGVTIFIALLGLFGLATFTIQRRKKEVGIRKVLGASIAQVVHYLNVEFLKLVLVAILIALPLSWYLSNRWLENFAYQVEIQWWIFAFSGLSALLLAFITVSIQSVQAAVSNPVNSLRNE